jgi:phosphohistidine phosphatase
MGKLLANITCVPDRILSSPAQRARQTAELVAKACGYTNDIKWYDSFYGGNNEDLISALQQLPRDIERAMLVGHNPTLEETVAALLTGPGVGGEEMFKIKMPTAALVCLDFEIAEWAVLTPGQAILRWFLIPKLV